MFINLINIFFYKTYDIDFLVIMIINLYKIIHINNMLLIFEVIFLKNCID